MTQKIEIDFIVNGVGVDDKGEITSLENVKVTAQNPEEAAKMVLEKFHFIDDGNPKHWRIFVTKELPTVIKKKI